MHTRQRARTPRAADLEPFWPSRRAWVTDEWCRPGSAAAITDVTVTHVQENP